MYLSGIMILFVWMGGRVIYKFGSDRSGPLEASKVQFVSVSLPVIADWGVCKPEHDGVCVGGGLKCGNSRISAHGAKTSW